MKLFTTILLSLVLLLTPFASLQTLAANCPVVKKTCCHQGYSMPCCKLGKSVPQPAPEIPAQKNGSESQIALLALAAFATNFTRPDPVSFSTTDQVCLTVVQLPLYTRHCTLLI